MIIEPFVFFMIKKLLLPLFSLFFCLTSNANEIKLADPTIFFEDGVYYLTGTGDTANGFTMYYSSDLVHWLPCGNATGGRALYKGSTFGTGSFWAPQIFTYGGKYYMAYAANEQIAVAMSSSPEGPYTQTTIKNLNGTTGQIDPYVFIDDDGKKYIYYVRFINGNSIYVGEIADDFQSIKEATITHCVSAVDGTWEMSPNAPTARVTEGPTVIKDGGYYYLIYSANHYQNIDYSVGYAYSTSPKGPWKKIGHPFLSRHNTGINGSGHGDMFRNADGEWFYVFHVHASNTTVQTRRTAVVPITVTDNPENKFVPQMDRMIILNDAVSPSATFPKAADTFVADGVNYTVTNATSKNVSVGFKDPVLFGGYEGELTIPESVEYNGETYSVNMLSTSAFYNCKNLQKVNLPSTMTKIGIGAFENSSIKSVEIPNTVTSIGYRAFADCSSLLDVIANRTTATSVMTGTFSTTTQQNGKLWIPDGTSDSYLANTEWAKFARVSGIEAGTLQYNFVVDGIYYSVVSEADATCQVMAQTNMYATYRGPEITIPKTVDYNGKTYKVEAVGRMAFRDSRLVEKINIPEGITSLGTYAMIGLYNMKDITLPATVNTISSYCFKDCNSLTSITCLAKTPPTLTTVTTFSNETYAGTLYVPAGTKSVYASANIWSRFANIVELQNTGINNISQEVNNSHGIYTLQGVKVSGKDNMNKGIYIVDGEKIIVR